MSEKASPSEEDETIGRATRSDIASKVPRRGLSAHRITIPKAPAVKINDLSVCGKDHADFYV